MFTSKAAALRTIARNVLRRGAVVGGSLGVHRMGHGRDHWRMALARSLHGEVVEGRHSGRQVVGRRKNHHEEGSHRLVGVLRGRSGRRDGHRSSRHVVVGCGGGSRHGEGCSREEVHGGHSSHRVVVHHSHHVRGSLQGIGSGSAHVGEGSRIEAGHICQLHPCRRDCGDVHQRCNGR